MHEMTRYYCAGAGRRCCADCGRWVFNNSLVTLEKLITPRTHGDGCADWRPVTVPMPDEDAE